jgi:hypothetical protein
MDFTETPHAEDFELEVNQLIQKYVNLGLDRGAVEEILYEAVENMFNCDEEEDS